MRVLAVVIGLMAVVGCQQSDPLKHAAAVARLAATTPRWVPRDALGKRLWTIEQRFYADRQHAPAWIDGETPARRLDDLLATLADARLHGLNPATYGLDELKAIRRAADERWIGAAFEAERVPEIDLRLTYAFLAHAADLLGWRSSSRAVDPNWIAAPKKVDLAAQLREAVERNTVRETLSGLAPTHSQYKGLQAALAEGARPAAERDRLLMNLERWRWAPRDLGERHILINVPSYQMQVVEHGAPVLAMRVIVGAPETPTPLFSDQMTYVVFSPYWNIPETILREETLPRLAEDPEYLARNNIEVVSAGGEVIDPGEVDWEDSGVTDALRFRQAPGPENALGLVKFIFPNHFSVYLHDTPGDALFAKRVRTLSHGCIRVEKPVTLAEYVLRDRTQWTPDRIRAAMTAGREETVTLKNPLPVHIGYWTAWVEPDGSITFLSDPYDLDRKQMTRHAD